MSEYQKQVETAKKQKCPACNGRGKQDDWGFGDTFFNEWVCPTCRGTGLSSQSSGVSQ